MVTRKLDRKPNFPIQKLPVSSDSRPEVWFRLFVSLNLVNEIISRSCAVVPHAVASGNKVLDGMIAGLRANGP